MGALLQLHRILISEPRSASIRPNLTTGVLAPKSQSLDSSYASMANETLYYSWDYHQAGRDRMNAWAFDLPESDFWPRTLFRITRGHAIGCAGIGGIDCRPSRNFLMLT